MLCHGRAIATGTYKIWGVGGVKHSKNISENNYNFFQQECPHQRNRILSLSILLEMHIYSQLTLLARRWKRIINLQQPRHKKTRGLNYQMYGGMALFRGDDRSMSLKVWGGNENKNEVTLHTYVGYRQGESQFVFLGRVGLVTWYVWPSLCPKIIVE